MNRPPILKETFLLDDTMGNHLRRTHDEPTDESTDVPPHDETPETPMVRTASFSYSVTISSTNVGNMLKPVVVVYPKDTRALRGRSREQS